MTSHAHDPTALATRHAHRESESPPTVRPGKGRERHVQFVGVDAASRGCGRRRAWRRGRRERGPGEGQLVDQRPGQRSRNELRAGRERPQDRLRPARHERERRAEQTAQADADGGGLVVGAQGQTGTRRLLRLPPAAPSPPDGLPERAKEN